MNYSVFKLQNQAGRPAIFWEKETIPKKDRKFGYKNNDQRFPIRRFADDRHHIDTDLVSLTPDEPPPPPKPAKNFIKRNRQKVTTKKGEPPSTVTLTQEQLNAILKSVGKVAGGSENAVKITVDKHNDTKEIVVESPRRHGRDDEDYDDDDYDDRRERRRKKKPDRKQEDQGASIYSLIEGKSKPKNTSDNESFDSDGSLELQRLTKKYKRRKDRKSRRQEEEDEEEDRRVRDRNRRNKNNDLDDDDNLREKRNRRNRPNANLQDEIDKEIAELRRHNKSKQSRDVDIDSDYEKENRRRRTRSKHRDSDDEDIDKDYDRKERIRKRDHSKERKGKSRNKSEDRDLDIHNTSSNKEDEELLPSPRDKVGLPVDLSWRHMTKAERRRLEIARRKVIDEEERKEEEKIKHLNARYDPEESFKKLPQRHLPTRSDPPATRQTRYDRGRDTENTNYTDGNRHGRRSRTPSDHRSPDRSPDLPSYTTPDTSPKVPVGIPRRHMTLAEKKRIEWEKDRVESVQMERAGNNSDPWGRPGAGAPIRTRSGHVVADYKGRQEHMHSDPILEEEPSAQTEKRVEQSSKPSEKRRPARGKSPSRQVQQPALDHNIPITMRSSFVLGQAAPDYDKLTSAKERERKQWLADLEKQIEDKRQKEMKQKDTGVEDTWADKFSQPQRPAQFPEQPREIVQSDKLNTSTDHIGALLETSRVQSAPEGDPEDHSSYIRGQNAPIDPVTKKELEDKRRRYLEHQEAVKAQVEEKERQKRMERERKMKEDMEEERKLQQERDMLQKQFDMEQQKMKQKEQQRQTQVNQLKAAMDEAQAKALQEKYQRKMQHLEAGGHDTKKLREHLEGEITSRIEQLHTRRERDILRARQLLELQHWGVTIAEEDEENQSQRPAEQPSDAKITPRDESVTGMDTSHIPGLDLSTARTHFPPQMPTTRRDQSQGHYSQTQAQAHYSQAQSQPHDPYTEDRVLTPSRFRHPSKPWSDPGSPRREFGTQTGNLNDSASDLDGDDLTELLNPQLRRDHSEVNIEYKYEKGKRVRVISAPKEAIEKRSRKPKQPHPPPSHREQSKSPHEHHHEVRNKVEKEEDKRKKRLELQRRKGPVKPGSRPMWGYKNAGSKIAKKQSERDPFYEEKKRESEIRRLKREQKLLAMVDANKPVIPDYYVPPPKSSRSRSRDLSPFSDLEMASPREVRQNRRSKSHSPNRSVLQGETEHSHGHGAQNERKSPERRRNQSRSPPLRGNAESLGQGRNTENWPSRRRNSSPPVPAMRHRSESNQNIENDPGTRKGGKYRDHDPLDAPIPSGDFVPFTRTIDVLDPTKAEEPVPLSREATRVANARRAYYEGLHPEKFGNRQYVFQDKHRVLPGDEEGKNPLMNPSLVLDHPTTRQDQILVQLSTLKQSLMQRQRELETFSPTDLVRMDTDIKA